MQSKKVTELAPKTTNSNNTLSKPSFSGDSPKNIEKTVITALKHYFSSSLT